MEYEIRFERLGSRPLAVVRRCARSHELSTVVPEACGTVWNLIRSEQIPGAGRQIAVYLDDRINLEVGVELGAPLTGSVELISSATPSGPVATTTHYGPYGLMHQAHEAILRWCGENGHTFAGPSWEIYGHWKEEWNSDPSKITTDIYYLLIDDGGSTAEPGAAADGGA